MGQKYETICFCEENYKEHYSYSDRKEVNETRMYEDITDFIRIAIKNGYQMKIGYDGMTVIIEYNYADEGMAGASLEWLGENEYVGNYDDDAKYNAERECGYDDDEESGTYPCN